jgi:hypothetical protein
MLSSNSNCCNDSFHSLSASDSETEDSVIVTESESVSESGRESTEESDMGVGGSMRDAEPLEVNDPCSEDMLENRKKEGEADYRSRV